MQHQALKWSCFWAMCELVDEILLVVIVAPAEQRAKNEWDLFSLWELYLQTLIFISTREEKTRNFLSIFRKTLQAWPVPTLYNSRVRWVLCSWEDSTSQSFLWQYLVRVIRSRKDRRVSLAFKFSSVEPWAKKESKWNTYGGCSCKREVI